MTRVTAPDGSAWTVRRRWYPWRRALSLQAIWHSTTDGDDKTADTTTASSDASEPSSGNPIVHALLIVLGAVLWLIIQGGKAALILLAAIVVVVLSVTDLILQLLVMPVVLLARACGVMRWPVQIDRNKQHFRTEHADGFSAAAALRDDLATQIQRGDLAPESPESTEPSPERAH
ncbi:MAG TPA: hypothetical protein VHI10_09225 [Mycobacterium sp.]|nr:hypothetical protein [Mycobacterium sp.]